MDVYAAKIKKYEVLMDFHAPILKAPHILGVELKFGDEILSIDGNVYVKMSESFYEEQKDEFNDGATYVQASFHANFVELNKKIFKEIK